MNETYVTITGNVVADPGLRTTSAGDPMTSFRIASTVRRPVPGRPGEFVDEGTSFYSVAAYKSLALNITCSVRRGDPVVVYGRQQVRQWTSQDRSGTSVDITAITVGHDLCRGQSLFRRAKAGVIVQQADRAADDARGDDQRSDDQAAWAGLSDGALGGSRSAGSPLNDDEPRYGESGYGDLGDRDSAFGEPPLDERDDPSPFAAGAFSDDQQASAVHSGGAFALT